MNKTAIGIILLVVGVIGLVAVYSMPPLSGFGDALMMIGQGRQSFIKEPLYQIFLAISCLVSLFGLILAAMSLSKSKEQR